MKKICEPNITFWNFKDETQIFSQLYYMGFLTYAEYELKIPCILKIPNSVVEKEFFQNLKNRIDKPDLVNSFERLFSFHDIQPILESIESFLEKTQNQQILLNLKKMDSIGVSI